MYLRSRLLRMVYCCHSSSTFYLLLNFFIRSGICYVFFQSLPRVTSLQQRPNSQTKDSPPSPPGPTFPIVDPQLCKYICEIHRPKGSTDAFSINCEDSKLSETFGLDCKHLCYSCGSREICDFSVRPFVIKCPSFDNLLPRHCQEICDYVRQIATTEENALGTLSFSCNNGTLFPFFDYFQHCKQTCKKCQDSICEYKNLKFTCPAITALGGGCKRQCDYRRPDGFFGSYSFDCANTTIFQTLWDSRQCLQDCGDCPEIVCFVYGKPVYTAKFNCIAVNENDYVRPPPPPTEPSYDDSDCEKRCDKSRPPRKSGKESDSFYFACASKYRVGSEEWRQCRLDCFTCPLEVCDPYERSESYRCPQPKPTPPPPTPKPGSFIVSWTIIALISMAVIACIIATGFYGRKNTVERAAPVQSQQMNDTEPSSVEHNS